MYPWELEHMQALGLCPVSMHRHTVRIMQVACMTVNHSAEAADFPFCGDHWVHRTQEGTI